MAKRTFLTKAAAGLVSILLCLAFAFGMVACNTSASYMSGSSGSNSELVVWTTYGNIEKVLQKRLESDPSSKYVDYSDYYDSDEVYLAVFKNELECTNIVLTAGNKKINYYDITLSDLTDGTNVLPKEAFTLYNQKYIENTPKEGIFGGGWYPDCLLPFDTAIKYKENFVDPHNNQAIYVQVKPSINQPAGVYTGTFVVTADGKNINVPVTVEVYDFVLPTSPVGQYHVGYNVNHLQGSELDCTAEEQIEWFDFFTQYRVSPGGLPGIGDATFSTYQGYQNFYKKWIPMARKYSLVDELGFYNLPYATGQYEITFETEEKDSSGKIIYLTDAEGNQILDENGKPIPKMKEVTQSHNMVNPSFWVNQLRAIAEGCFDDPTTEGPDEFINLFEKAGVYFVYFDEFSSTAGKDLTAISSLQFVVFAAHLVSDEFVYKWTHDETPELTPEEQLVVDSIYGIKFKAISTSTLPLQDSDYVLRFEFAFRDDYTSSPNNFGSCSISDWAANYKYYGQYDEDNGTDVPGKEPIYSVSGNRATLKMESWTECVFITGITNYATEGSRKEYLEYAQKNQFYNHEGWVYTAENPKYPQVNVHLDTSLWSARAMGWMQADYDATGNLYWAGMFARHFITISPQYLDYIQDYYQTAERYRGTNGEGFLSYIGRPYEEAPMASLRLHATRDANEDYDLLYYLEQFYIESAEARGVEYDDTGYKNILHTMTGSLYDGVKVIKVTNDQHILDARKLVASLLVMGEKTGAIVENYEIQDGGVMFTIYAPNGVEIKMNGAVKTPTTAGDVNEYKIYIPLTANVQNVRIGATKDGATYEAGFTLQSLKKTVEAGSLNGTVLPEKVGGAPVSAGNITKDTLDGVSVINGNFTNYMAIDVNGAFVKVAETGDISADYVEIDVTNTVVRAQRYIKISDTNYFATASGDVIKGADGNYYVFSNTSDDYFDATYSKLKRYTDATGAVVDMDNGTFIKAADGTFFEFANTAADMDTTSIMVLAYSYKDGKFVEDSAGSYRLKKDGDVSNPDDYVQMLSSEVTKRYKLGTDRHQLQIDISSFGLTDAYSLLAIKVHVSKDMTVTIGGLAGTQVEYGATVYTLKAGWNELHVKPNTLGATTTRNIKQLRIRLAGVEDGTTLTVGKMYVIK